MARWHDQTGENVTRKNRKERNYGTKTDLSSTTVERGNTHWTDSSNVNIDGFLGVAGTQRVTGLLDVTGTFNGSGTNNMDGTNNLSGDNNFSGDNDFTGPTTMSGTFDQNGESTFNGPTHFNGSVDITETLDVTAETRLRGETTVEADLIVTNEGKIKVGTAMTLSPITDGGAIDFTNGTKISSEGTYLNMKAGFGSVGVSSTSVSMNAGGGALMELRADNSWLVAGGGGSVIGENGGLSLGYNTRIDLTAPKTWINGQLEATGVSRFPQVFIGAGTEIASNRLKIGSLPNTSVATANVHVDSNGIFYRVNP